MKCYYIRISSAPGYILFSFSGAFLCLLQNYPANPTDLVRTIRYLCRDQNGNKSKRRKKATKRRDIKGQRPKNRIFCTFSNPQFNGVHHNPSHSFFISKSNHLSMVRSPTFHYLFPFFLYTFSQKAKPLNRSSNPCWTCYCRPLPLVLLRCRHRRPLR